MKKFIFCFRKTNEQSPSPLPSGSIDTNYEYLLSFINESAKTFEGAGLYYLTDDQEFTKQFTRLDGNYTLTFNTPITTSAPPILKNSSGEVINYYANYVTDDEGNYFIGDDTEDLTNLSNTSITLFQDDSTLERYCYVVSNKELNYSDIGTMPSILKIENSSIDNINGIYGRLDYIEEAVAGAGYYGGYVNSDGTIFIRFMNDGYLEEDDLCTANLYISRNDLNFDNNTLIYDICPLSKRVSWEVYENGDLDYSFSLDLLNNLTTDEYLKRPDSDTTMLKFSSI